MGCSAVNFMLEDLDYLWREGVVTDSEKRRITIRIHKCPEKWAKRDKISGDEK